MNRKITFIAILAINATHPMQYQNTNPTQTTHKQVLQSMNQQFVADNNQRNVNNYMTSEQPIPSSLISGMHPSQAAGAYIYNTNLSCQKK